jgi:ferric-dicitrate binding protein FerR (iron transport regulator)
MPSGAEAASLLPEPDAPRRRRRGLLALALLAGVGAVLLLLYAASGSTVAADGTLTEAFGMLALGTLSLTGAGLVGLALLFRDVRRSSPCGREGCSGAPDT